MDKQELLERRIYRDRRDRTDAHSRSICGGMSNQCQECFKDQLNYLRSWAKEQSKPLPGENAMEYWRRIKGPFWDAWLQVASEMVKLAERRK